MEQDERVPASLTALIQHKKSHEFASYIINAVLNDVPYRIHGNVLNTGLITNLPQNACVEVPCMVDRNGINPCYVGELPEQCAALNRTNINTQLMTIKAAETLKKEYIYMAAMLDPTPLPNCQLTTSSRCATT